MNWMVVNGVAVAPAFQLSISLPLNDLPPAQQGKVTGLVTQALNYEQALTVPAGSYFATSLDADGKIHSQRAAEPLQAVAAVAPFTPRRDMGVSCTGFICAGGVETQTASSTTGLQWNILVSVARRWRFRGASGALLGDAQFPPGDAAVLSLAYNGAGDWSLSSATLLSGPINALAASAFCAAGALLLEHLAGSADGAIGLAYDRGRKAANCC